jgi:hypothetical protein
MSNNKQTETDFNIIFVFTLEYYKNSRLDLDVQVHKVLMKMQTYLKENTKRINQKKYEKVISGAREMDNYTLDILAHSHNVCIEINQHPNSNVEQFYNTSATTAIYLNLKEYCSTETNVDSKKRKRIETFPELKPTKVEKNSEEGRIKSEPETQELKDLFIDSIKNSYHKAQIEIDSLVFTNLKKHLNHATIIGSFQKAQTLKDVEKFKFYTKLKDIYLKKYKACWKSCVHEMLKLSNSLKVQEHINNHMVTVESILYTYLNGSLKKHFGEAMDKKKGKTEHFSTKIEKTAMDQVKEKLKQLLLIYIKGFLVILSEKDSVNKKLFI